MSVTDSENRTSRALDKDGLVTFGEGCNSGLRFRVKDRDLVKAHKASSTLQQGHLPDHHHRRVVLGRMPHEP